MLLLFDFNGNFDKIRAIQKQGGPRAHFLFVRTDLVDLSGLLEKAIGGLGFELVDLELANHGRLLRIFIDKAGGVNIDDCAAVSNHLTRLLAVENVEYDRLEISSPGLDRPLKRSKDFQRFAGERVQVKLRIPLNGRKRLAGVLQNVREDGFQLDVDGELLTIAFADIAKARLVPNI